MPEAPVDAPILFRNPGLQLQGLGTQADCIGLSLAAGTLAGYIPAHRASRLGPMVGRGGGDRIHDPKTGKRAGTLNGLIKSGSEKQGRIV